MAGISISLDLPTLQNLTVEAELNNETISACAKRLILAALDSPDLLSKKRTRKNVEADEKPEPGSNRGVIVRENQATGERVIEKDGAIIEDTTACPRGYKKCYVGGCKLYDTCTSVMRIDTEESERT